MYFYFPPRFITGHYQAQNADRGLQEWSSGRIYHSHCTQGSVKRTGVFPRQRTNTQVNRNIYSVHRIIQTQKNPWQLVVGRLDDGSINQSWCTIIMFGRWCFYTFDYFKMHYKTSVIHTFLYKLLSFSQITPYFWSVLKYFSLVYVFRHFVGAH